MFLWVLDLFTRYTLPLDRGIYLLHFTVNLQYYIKLKGVIFRGHTIAGLNTGFFSQFFFLRDKIDSSALTVQILKD